jgi:hypothetical protein
MFLGSRSLLAHKADLSGQCGILNISQSCRSQRPVTGIVCFLYVDGVRTSQEAQNSIYCYGDSFTFLYADDVRISQEAQTSTACYGDSFSFLLDDVRISQEAQTSTACYGDSFSFLY